MKASQIHCFFDCLSYIVDADPYLDSRPVYIGVWDSPFGITDEGILYYGTGIRINQLAAYFTTMYGSHLENWIDYDQSREDNWLLFKQQIIGESEYLIIMVDLYNLPNSLQYQKKHLPHLVIVQRRTEDGWYLIDPYFGWEGEVAEEHLEKSFGCANLLMGITIDANVLSQPSVESVSAQFIRSFNPNRSKMVSEVHRFIDRLENTQAESAWKHLHYKLENLAIISKRLRGYSQLFTFFSLEQGQNMDELRAVDKLVMMWDQFLVAVFRIGLLGKNGDIAALKSKLTSIKQHELTIKKKLLDAFEEWRAKNECFIE
ncbi:DUF6005 family protein [Paenibacillus sp. LPE1-1-1.1]|uniref:DUF6005 family protein n=1 Tax=Paenibacillus sp. LPE1-1-1.1 TaxID=3135230 RepID=UPI003439B66A